VEGKSWDGLTEKREDSGTKEQKKERKRSGIEKKKGGLRKEKRDEIDED